ncbi:hypothetical protein [uncultured Campylobacter sp.]|uniref:gp53-like domain-containing protein n=1 Tax=uncultured Campylobacter sp. TaxID=218934 RepID=UPI003211A06B
MIYKKPKNEIFASDAKDGEIVDFPNVKRGWGVTENLGFIPPMEYFNSAFNRVDKALAYQSQRGISEWSADEEYPVGALSVFGGELYQAKTQNSNKKPSDNPDIWVGFLDKTEKAADSDKLDGLDSSSFLQTSQAELVCQYAHQIGQVLPDGDYSSSDFWLSIKPGIYYATREKGRNGPNAYGIVEVIGAGEVSIIWNYLGRVWKWYQVSSKHNSGWQEMLTGTKDAAATANTIVARDANGDFESRYISAASFKSTANNDDNLMDVQSCIMYWSPNDRFMRPASLAKFKEIINGVDFACQKNPNGYTKLPNGLILQWGVTTTTEVIFPIAFNKRLNVSLTSAEDECEFVAAVVNEAKIENPSNTGFKIGARRIAGTTPDWFKFYWFAIGY